MTPKQEAAIISHGEQLNAIFHTGLEPITLCKKLRRIEGAAHKLAEDACNFLNMESPAFKTRYSRIVKRVIDVVGQRVRVKINLDPRGYALKIDDQVMNEKGYKLHRDWGGYGILAPEFDKEGR